MAVRFKDFDIDEVGYSEMQWAKPEEISLLASITLARNTNEQVIMLYPLPDYQIIETTPDINLNNPDVLKKIKNLLISEHSTNQHILTASREGRYPSLPPALGGPSYTDVVDSLLLSEQSQIYKSISPKDHLLIRGLSTFLRSYMVSLHHHLIEEATLSLYVSLEASFRLVLRRLVHLGVNNPTAKDAAEYIAKEFEEDPIDKYFEEYYNDRIATLHPESRFGVFPHAPLCVDDCYDLQEGLFAMYNLLTAGRTHLDS